MNIEPITFQQNLKGLRHLYDTVESQVRSLKALGVSADSYGSMLSSVFMNKLYEELRLIISRHVREDKWTLDAIINVTEGEIIARERAVGDPKGLQVSQPAHFLPADQEPQSHTSSMCRTVTNASERVKGHTSQINLRII